MSQSLRKRKLTEPQPSTSVSVELTPKRTRVSTGDQKRAGIINRIVLKNFMCHSFLDVDLSGNVHILIGQNGSGKSAILTALIVGLGGRASLTNRGSSCTNFVKVGKKSGSVEIRLYNGGPLAYQADVYGEEITVMRTITASGSGQYKILGAAGKVISTRAKEVKRITTSLNIQVDNPVCILNQDTSRNFLTTDDPKYKYQLFLKATRLETLYEEYKTINLNKVEAINLYKEKQQYLKELQAQLRVLQEKIDVHKKVDEFRHKYIERQVELVWAKVRDVEADFGAEEAALNELKARQATLVEKAENTAEKLKALNEQIQNRKSDIVKLRASMKTTDEPEVKNTVNELQSGEKRMRLERKYAMERLERQKLAIRDLQHQIDTIGVSVAKAEEENRVRKENKVKTGVKLNEVAEQIATVRNDLSKITQEYPRIEEEKENLGHSVRAIENRITNIHQTITSLKSSTGNSLCVYWREMPRLQQLIEIHRARFRQLPCGPLGSHIRLKDKKWALAVENHIGSGLLKAFLVDNEHDEKLLRQLFDEAFGANRRQPMLIRTKFTNKRHNVRPNAAEAPEGCIALLDTIEVGDVNVFNCLVDQKQIEETLVVPDNDWALTRFASARLVPRNCSQGVTLNGEAYYPDPNFRTYGALMKRPLYIEVDQKASIREFQLRLETFQTEKEQKQTQFRQLSQVNNNKNEIEHKLQKLVTIQTQLQQQLRNIENHVEVSVPNADFLEQEMVELKVKAQQYEAEINQFNEKIKTTTNVLRDEEEKLNQLKNVNYKLLERIGAIQDEIVEDEQKIREIKISEEYDKRRTGNCDEKVKEAKARRDVLREKIETQKKQALQLGERVETGRDVVTILEDMKKLQRGITRVENESENGNSIIQKHKELTENIDILSESLQCIEFDIKELEQATNDRKVHCKTTTDYMVLYMRHAFQKIMNIRQYYGEILISHNDKKLELKVRPPDGAVGGTDARNLSGGERSFSTSAFLFSLWQCMNSPFYFLDEFDVYMDKMNRSRMTEILLHHAELHPDSQFVFLTPQDVSFVKRNVSILRLSAPERTQSQIS